MDAFAEFGTETYNGILLRYYCSSFPINVAMEKLTQILVDCLEFYNPQGKSHIGWSVHGSFQIKISKDKSSKSSTEPSLCSWIAQQHNNVMAFSHYDFTKYCSSKEQLLKLLEDTVESELLTHLQVTQTSFINFANPSLLIKSTLLFWYWGHVK